LSDHLDLEDLALFAAGSLAASASLRAFEHLAVCELCRRRLEPRLPPALPPEAEAPGSPCNQLEQPGRDVIYQVLRVFKEEAAAAPLQQALSSGECSYANLSLAELAPLGGFVRVDILLRASDALRFVSPAEMVRLAELAVCELHRLPARQYGNARLADLSARAWAELGNAYRVADDLPGAASCLEWALRWVARGTGDAWLTALVSDLWVSLSPEQGSYAEAIATLDRFLLLYNDGLTETDCHVREGSPLALVRRRWLWGRLYSGLGIFAQAEEALQAARAGFAVAGEAYHQALATLDLAEVCVRHGKRAAARYLADEMLVVFRRLGIAREVIALLLLARERCLDSFLDSEALCYLFREVAVVVAELDRTCPRLRRPGAKLGELPSPLVH
jgi:tetratricopeptide (TPR) repeat protein